MTPFEAQDELIEIQRKALVDLRAELAAERERADKAEAEIDRLSERMRVRLVEYGEKTDAALAALRQAQGVLDHAPLYDDEFDAAVSAALAAADAVLKTGGGE